MDHIWERVGSQLLARVSGPMKFRLVLQPAMAAFFAIRAGLADARAGKTPYFWCLLSDPRQRVDMLKDGWKSVGRVFILALVLDALYQMIVLHFVYPGEMIIVAFVNSKSRTLRNSLNIGLFAIRHRFRCFSVFVE